MGGRGHHVHGAAPLASVTLSSVGFDLGSHKMKLVETGGRGTWMPNGSQLAWRVTARRDEHSASKGALLTCCSHRSE